jgi:thiol-disulfide isomerase/thioredoxin
VGVFAAALIGPAFAGVGIGDRMPVLSVTGANAEAIEIDVGGSGVVAVEFWAAWCKACRETLPALGRLARKRRADGFQAIAVSIDRSRPQADAFLAENLAAECDALRVVYDPGGDAMARLGPSGLPALYVIEDGVVRMAQGGWAADGAQRLERMVDTLLRRRVGHSAEPRPDVSTEVPADQAPSSGVAR